MNFLLEGAIETHYQKGRGLGLKGRVPSEAAFFQDHFPAFPVLPGVLALEILKRTAELLGEKENPGRKNTASRLCGLEAVRFNSFLRPGDEWEADLQLEEGEASGKSMWKAKLVSGERTAASARLILESQRHVLMKAEDQTSAFF